MDDITQNVLYEHNAAGLPPVHTLITLLHTLQIEHNTRDTNHSTHYNSSHHYLVEHAGSSFRRPSLDCDYDVSKERPLGITECWGQHPLRTEAGCQAGQNLLICPKCPQLQQLIFFLGELCDVLAQY